VDYYKQKEMKTYYHVIEDCGNGNIGSQGYYTTLTEAEAEVSRLSDYFPRHNFYVFPSNSKKEPVIVTI
jgi:hypothetical protein